jgi:archaellum component FlaC
LSSATAPLYNGNFRGKLKSMEEQKVIKSFTVVSKHLSKIDKEIENIQKETAELKENLDMLQTCFDSLFSMNLN